MRILTVRQPWAWAIIHGGKDVENRVRNIAGGYRGPVAVHAGQGVGSSIEFSTAWAQAESLSSSRFGERHDVRGAIIGVVDLVDVHASEWMPDGALAPSQWVCSRWAEPNTQHLVLANPRPLAKPIPYKGALGLRRFNETVDARVLRELEALA